tara:strand:- start:18558 stop:19013 length:456 start_codon:yes stop_codon:yes gene_type:complete
MSQKEWGNITWFLFHSLAERIKEEYFPVFKQRLITFITSTCDHLPCPICAGHATETLRKANIGLINTKGDFIEFLRQFHNIVNIKLKKSIFTKEEVLIKYKRGYLPLIIQQFFKVYTHNYKNMSALMSAFQRKLFITQQKAFLNTIIAYCN